MSVTEQLDVLMQNQRRAIRWYVCFATILFSLGLLLLVGMLIFGHRVVASDPFKTMLGIAGGLVSSVSVFPLKEVNGCRDRLTIYRKLRVEVDSSPDTDKNKIESLVWDVVKKVALG